MKRKFTITLLLFVCAIFCALGLAACNSEDKVTGITLNKTELTLNVGESEQLTATLSPDNVDSEIYWSSDDANIAQVDQTGNVTVRRVGTATITATTQNNLQAVCTVTVKKPAESVDISDGNHGQTIRTALLVGSKITLKAIIYPEDSTTTAAVWTVDAPDVVSVDGGKITALSQGISTVTATADGVSDQVRLTVTEDGLEYVLSKDEQSYSVEQNYGSLFTGEKELTEITVASKFNGKPVTSIGRWAFSSRDTLKKIVIPASITSIDTNSIGYCKALECIEVAEDNPVYASVGGILYNKAVTESIFVPYAISGVVEIPETMTKITDGMFYDRDGLTGVKMHDGVTAIGESAFGNCDRLHSFTVTANVTEIGKYAFSGCEKLWEIYNFSQLKIETGGDGYTATYGHIGRYALNIIYDKDYPSGIRETDDGLTFYVARENKTYLVDYTGKDAELTLPDSYNGVGYVIHSNAFYGCETITSVTIPDSVTAIGEYAFAHCKNLVSVSMGSGLESIGDNAFADCDSLKNVTVPDSVNSLGSWAFKSCSSLTNVVLGKGVTKIWRGAFAYCEALQEITVQDGLTYISAWSFDRCGSLKKINFNGTKEQWNAVKKDENWDVDLVGYTVHCTDGDVAKSGN